uniref:Amidohydrolase-related domain-containing protein n=1 Tax=Alexandrium catenella TaxID=2925 RepID=A0A7S1W403_ALECA
MGAALGCPPRAKREQAPLTDYIFTRYAIIIWQFSDPAGYQSKGAPQAGDRVTEAMMEEHRVKGESPEDLLKKGLIEPVDVKDRSKLPQSGWVYTASFIEMWKGGDVMSWVSMGAPKAGDPVTVAEVNMHALGHKGDQERLATLGLTAAAPDSPWVHKTYKVDDDLEEWTALTPEKPMEPLYPIVDPHHHLWQRKRAKGTPLMPFEGHSFGTRQAGHAYLHDQLQKDAAGNGVVGTVFLECNTEYEGGWPMEDQTRSAAESKWVQGIADKTAQPMAIVAHLDLFQGRESVEKGLAAHREVAPNLVGVRHALAWHKSNPVYSRVIDGQIEKVSEQKSFREAVDVLGEQGLTFDTWLFHTNLQELIDLAKACPKTQIVCDHVGAPLGVSLAGLSLEKATEEWKGLIVELAKCENVVVKLSGLSMPVCGFAFNLREKPPTSAEMAAAYKPYFAHCLEHFGPSRCLFASNFPVDKVSGGYTTHWNAFKIIAKELLPDDEAAQRALLYDNSVRIYRMDKPPFGLPSRSTEAEELPKY